MFRMALVLVLAAGSAVASDRWTWWVEDCTADAVKYTGCDPRDPELARWALEAWGRESGGRLQITKAVSKEDARIRIHWATGASNLYGEARPILVNGEPGAEIYVLPDLHALGRDIEEAGANDPLFREAVVYLTCLHESGHALGLPHTAKFADIMYTFRYGGDIVGYFERYRKLLRTREDIRKNSGISDEDRQAIRK